MNTTSEAFILNSDGTIIACDSSNPHPPATFIGRKVWEARSNLSPFAAQIRSSIPTLLEANNLPASRSIGSLATLSRDSFSENFVMCYLLHP